MDSGSLRKRDSQWAVRKDLASSRMTRQVFMVIKEPKSLTSEIKTVKRRTVSTPGLQHT